jgi:hypothetical protein
VAWLRSVCQYRTIALQPAKINFTAVTLKDEFFCVSEAPNLHGSLTNRFGINPLSVAAGRGPQISVRVMLDLE